MGLDGVELVMAIEEKFGVSISDPEAEEVLTVGDMRRLVHSKLTVTDEPTCLTQQAFHLIRRHAIQLFGVPRRAVTPDVFFADIVPKDNRREIWSSFQSNLGITDLPDLARPAVITVSVTAVFLAILVSTFWYWAITQSVSRLLIGIVIAICVGWAGAEVTKDRKTEFRDGYSRVSDLARYVVARFPQLLGKPRSKTWTEEEVSCLLREVITAQTGISQFDENSRFVADLHLD